MFLKEDLLLFRILALLIGVILCLPATGHAEGPPTIDMDSVYVSNLGSATVEITVSAANLKPAGEFELTFSYDPQSLRLLFAEPIGTLADWEYFTYRYTQQDTCPEGCPVDLVQLSGIADLPNGTDPGMVDNLNGEIINLVFRTTGETKYIGQCVQLVWTWTDCENNTFTSTDGDTTYLFSEITNVLPAENCLNSGEGENQATLEFFNGLICLVPIEDRGDINLNGHPYEIGDAIMYANYFIYGPPALGYLIDPWYDNRVLASDVNDDGIPLTLSDLFCLLCMITSGENSWECCGGD